MKKCYRNWDISQFLTGQDFYISWAPTVQRRLDMIGVPVSEVCLLLRHDGMVFCFAERPRFLGNGMDIDGHLGNLDILDLGWKRFWLPTIFHQQKAGWFWLYQQSRLGATVMVSLLVQLSSCGSWGWRPGCEPLRPQKRIRNSSARQLGGGTVPYLKQAAGNKKEILDMAGFPQSLYLASHCDHTQKWWSKDVERMSQKKHSFIRKIMKNPYT
jgi:hypothetical protein